MSVISPTVGRVVLYFEEITPGNRKGPFAALVAKVWGDRMVNLAVFDENGSAFNRTSVKLLQGDDTPGGSSIWCEWMPFQKGQAAKTEQLEKQMAAI